MTSRPFPPAVILAAGRGNRLLPLTADRPKCLMTVGERTLLDCQTRALRMAGIEAIQVVTGHGADRVREACNGDVTYAHNADFDRTNSIDSLGCIELEIGPAGLMILNSDVLFHPDAVALLLGDARENVLLADFRPGLGEEEMKIVADGDGRLTHISKTIDPHLAHAENLGVLRLGQGAARAMVELARRRDRKPGISWVPDGIHHLRNEFAFHALAIGALPWTEIDYPHDLAAAQEIVYPKIKGALWGE